ncbi:Cof-type HAD-IIB family hydrolase [Neobacillus sp. PS3-34]|uniref:Cof-type HAD-IIB family hydrolase n=1 Tax=Neobacillus sp. PS3-34 TaxID=3070678 RepID=UPI0027E1ECF4|nr:Cof-type HAD-IIB family hydrolase [Neobacillus sp. PS3-34]WML50433.1 Cof-type HAD-IIB family hydrolase [Neobacillus sp. PS3-34]
MIKCIATDMDGTLLNSTQKVSKENKEAILKAQAQGIEVVVATGRSYQEAIFAIEEAGLKCPIIGVNGAEVRSENGEIISANPLTKQEAREAAVKLIENEAYFEVYTNKGTFTNDAEKSVSIIVDVIMSANPDANYEAAIKAADARVKIINIVDDYEKLFVDDQYKIYKLLAFSFDSDRLEAARQALEEIPGIVASSSGDENLEITSRDAQKGIALEAFASSRGISMAETMAIGDNYNDVSMFQKAGRAVAMGNAPELIKAQCDYTTLTNEESGVAKAILEVLQ